VIRLFVEKGPAFYLHQPLFHAKLSLFVLMGLMSIYPTVRMLAWRRAAASQGGVAPPEYRRVLMVVRLELALLLVLPFLASLMASGIA
jgi:putative membrane protein